MTFSVMPAIVILLFRDLPAFPSKCRSFEDFNIKLLAFLCDRTKTYILFAVVLLYGYHRWDLRYHCWEMLEMWDIGYCRYCRQVVQLLLLLR